MPKYENNESIYGFVPPVTKPNREPHKQIYWPPLNFLLQSVFLVHVSDLGWSDYSGIMTKIIGIYYAKSTLHDLLEKIRPVGYNH